MRNLGGPGLQEAQSALKSRFLLEDPTTDRPAVLGKSPSENPCLRRSRLRLRLEGRL